MTKALNLTKAQARALALRAVRGGDKGVGLERLCGLEQVLDVEDYCQSGERSGRQIDKGREPHLLIADPYNEDEFLLEPIYDCRAGKAGRHDEKYLIDVRKGKVLVDADTVVYWK